MTIQSNHLSEHKVHRLRQMFRQHGIWAMLLGLVTYDSADDGPEVNIIKFFNQYPEGTKLEFLRRVYLEVE